MGRGCVLWLFLYARSFPALVSHTDNFRKSDLLNIAVTYQSRGDPRGAPLGNKQVVSSGALSYLTESLV